MHLRRLFPFGHDLGSISLPRVLRLRLRLKPPRQQLAQPVRVGHCARQPRLTLVVHASVVVEIGKHAAALGCGAIGRQSITPPAVDSVRPRFEGLDTVGPARVVAMEAQVDAPVAACVRVGAQGRVATRLQGAPGAVLLLLLVVGWVGDVDAAEAEAVTLEDWVGFAPPVSWYR